MVDALRDRLYTPATLEPLLAEVRAALLQKAEDYRKTVRLEAESPAIAQLEAEIENIKAAVAMGKATQTLLGMLEEREAQMAALRSRRVPPVSIEERLSKALDRLPVLIEEMIGNLHDVMETQVDLGKEIIAALVEGITLYPTPQGLEAEIRGNLEGLIKFNAPGLSQGQKCKSVGSGGRILTQIYSAEHAGTARQLDHRPYRREHLIRSRRATLWPAAGAADAIS